jgi:signal transduction histidine kinase
VSVIRLRSLSARLIFYWIVGSLLAYFTLPATVLLPLTVLHVGDYAYTNLEGWTTKRPRDIILASLRQVPDGAKYVEFTEALRAHMARNPEFRFAVYDAPKGVLLPGSSAELAAEFAGLDRVEFVGGMFHLASDANMRARGYIKLINSPIGEVRVVTYGSNFHWDDVFYQLYNFLTLNNFIAYLPLSCAMSLIAVVVIKRGLAPLRSIAARVASVDVNTLNQRIPDMDLPSEVVHFVEAVNSALTRVDDGVARQRRFTANAAHELRTPIAILRARADKLAEMPLKHEIGRDVRRIQNIVEQLLVLAQLKERGDIGDPHVDLNIIILNVAADYMPIAIDNRRHIEFDAPPGPVMARGYPWAIESIVTNLIENAVRAEPEGGTVVVRVLPNAEIEVIDHGPGVTPAERELIFEPFWRRDERTPGTGLGLSIVRELLHKIGGSILVDATPGGGATFRVSLEAIATEIVGSRTQAPAFKEAAPAEH